MKVTTHAFQTPTHSQQQGELLWYPAFSSSFLKLLTDNENRLGGKLKLVFKYVFEMRKIRLVQCIIS